MRTRAIILLLAWAALGGCAWLDAPDTAAPTNPIVVVPIEVPAGSIFAAPPVCGPDGQLIPVPQTPYVPGAVPEFPSSATLAPPALPAAVPPPMTPLAITSPSDQLGLPTQIEAGTILPNPLRVPVANHEYAWDQIAQVVANYFPIQREDRVRVEGDAWMEGRIETPYRTGSTAFEPWRGDSVGEFNLWQSTLQTIRRRALVRVVPEGNQYAIEVQVDKELEDLPQPERATAGAAIIRTDTSLPSAVTPQLSRTRPSPVWIPLGRDAALEQKMLSEIQARLGAAPDVRTTVLGGG